MSDEGKISFSLGAKRAPIASRFGTKSVKSIEKAQPLGPIILSCVEDKISDIPVPLENNIMVQISPAVRLESKYDPQCFGLQLRQHKPRGKLTQKSKTPLISVKPKDSPDSFSKQIDSLPETAMQDTYERVPIESFGESMLKQMGWDPQSAPKTTGPTIKLRPKLLGLGADPNLNAQIRSPTSPLSSTSSDSQKQFVLIVKGIHAGLTGWIEDYIDERIILNLEFSGERLSLNRKYVVFLGDDRKHDIKTTECGPSADQLLQPGALVRFINKKRLKTLYWKMGIITDCTQDEFYNTSLVVHVLTADSQMILKGIKPRDVCAKIPSKTGSHVLYALGNESEFYRGNLISIESSGSEPENESLVKYHVQDVETGHIHSVDHTRIIEYDRHIQ